MELNEELRSTRARDVGEHSPRVTWLVLRGLRIDPIAKCNVADSLPLRQCGLSDGTFDTTFRGYTSNMRRVVQITAWMFVLVAAVLTLVPPGYRPATPLPRGLEHFGIFVIIGLSFGFGYPKRHLLQLMLLVTFTAILEMAQLFVVGRHAQVTDFLVDAAGVAIGLTVAFAHGRRLLDFS